ncbi:MAG: flagellar GTP-binding protein, partial [Phycisphaeraceae bacterium]
VLIDTAGRSQRDDPHLEELASFIDAADPHEVHLVLSSTCTQRVLLDTIERFSTIRTDRIIFTKLDEAVTFGVIINVMRTVRKRLSYVTTGQEVPHQIEPGRPERLAELVLGGGELAS